MVKQNITKRLRIFEAFFEGQNRQIYKYRELSKILKTNKEKWNLPKSFTFGSFVQLLLEATEMERIVLNFPSRKETIFTWKTLHPYQIANSLKKNAYFTHYTAMDLHNLTDQIPKTIYLNSEQSPKPAPPELPIQERIDAAFLRKPRISNNIADYGGYRICLLSGKHTSHLGVSNVFFERGIELPVSNLERTLIDITVRPYYSGGVFEVLEGYRRSLGRVDVGKLADILDRLNYIYPYYQAIGFYLEKAGYGEEDLKFFANREFEFNFYLTHQIKVPEYSERWRLFYPKGF